MAFRVPRAAAALAAALLLAAGRPALADSLQVSSFPPYPQGRVGITQPVLSWQLVPGGFTVSGGSFTVNGNSFPATVGPNDLLTASIGPLLPGSYQATATAHLHTGSGGYDLNRSWSFTIDASAAAQLPTPGPAASAALAEVNQFRRFAALPLEAIDPTLLASAAGHARYVLLHWTDSPTLAVHDEVAGLAGYTGRSVLDRAAYFGYTGVEAWEDIHFLGDPKAAVDDWMNSVYHRLPLVDPLNRSLGYALQSDALGRAVDVLDTGSTYGTDWTAPVAYPAAGQADVPTTFDDLEIPDPLRLFPGAQAPVGFPITLSFFSPHVTGISVGSATLTDAAGNQLPTYLLTPANDSELQVSAALLPAQPLQGSSRYNVHLTGQYTDDQGTAHSFDQRWFFLTHGTLTPRADFSVVLNGRPLSFDTVPLIENGHALVPLRALVEALGGQVDWDGDTLTATVTKGGTTAQLRIQNDLARINGQTVALDSPPVIYLDRTLVPLRFLSQSLGLQVSFDPQSGTIGISGS